MSMACLRSRPPGSRRPAGLSGGCDRSSCRQPDQGRGRKGMFLLVVVTVKLAIDLYFPDAVSFAYLNPASLRLPIHGSPMFPSASPRYGVRVSHVRLLRPGRAHVSEEHCGTSEFFLIIIGFSLVVFVPARARRLHEPFSQVVDETRFRPRHVGDRRLRSLFMGLYAPLEIGRSQAGGAKASACVMTCSAPRTSMLVCPVSIRVRVPRDMPARCRGSGHRSRAWSPSPRP